MRTVPNKLSAAIKASNSMVCCGLDPDIRKIPSVFSSEVVSEQRIYEFLTRIVQLTAADICAYKIQKAFFDLYPDGSDLLRRVVTYVRQFAPSVPIIIDCKIGDIDNTMEAYLQSMFEYLDADAVVVNPYMGTDVWKPIMSYPDKAGIVLVRTSNPGSALIQEVELADGQPLWHYILNVVVREWQNGGNLFPVLSSNSAQGLEGIRNVIPDDMPVLLAGVGAQGGNLTYLRHLIDSNGAGVVVNSSRALLYPYSVDDPGWEHAVSTAVINLKNAINAQRP